LETGLQWINFEEPCEPAAGSLHGSLVGEVTTIGVRQLTNTLTFAVASGNQDIREIILGSGEKYYPELIGYLGAPATIEGTEDLNFEAALDVT
jgi:hypothetical protein